MKATTELLIALAAIVVTVYFGWQLCLQTIVAQIQANQRVAQLEQGLNQCLQQGVKNARTASEVHERP